METRHSLPPVRLFIGMVTSDTLSPECADCFELTGLNGAGNNRRLTAAGVLQVIPVHVSSIARLIDEGTLPVDVALVRVRPSRAPGHYTVGVVADYTQALVRNARCVVAELDERMPETAHDALVAADDIDVWLEADKDQILLHDAEPSIEERAVARHVASVIPNRATVQFGIGGLSVAVAQALRDHRDLGVHSGVVSDALVDLIENGTVTNAYKGVDEGVSVTGCLFGSDRLNAHASGNPAVALRAATHTHNGEVMARLKSLYSVNSAIEVDLTGQVNAEQAGGRYLGAVGGQIDFVRGAQLSPGGRSIIALPSTTPDGRTSRIVASLAGRPVTTARSEVDLVVTEYGVADLRGCSFARRMEHLAAIAHPAFRDALLREARDGARPRPASQSVVSEARHV
ncbi:MAG: hypothetical protein KF792_04930 [Chelatococcus sp.]|nr:acetyl-CoA hydrolase/transferase C-terminal domain-containing protein [Chelatococcus sp.]MBS7701040.1 hypothetical protein [Chelatococcus sp. YT9]MBX3555573.1 hypothetical protein [Chelatococcus sp.]